MKRKLFMSVGIALGLVGASSALTNLTIYSDFADGQLEVRDALPPINPWPQIQDTGGWEMGCGEWYGAGLTTPVLPFQLPDFGPIVNPFASAKLGVRLHLKGDATITPVDLYGVRIDASPLIATSDWYNGVAIDPSATLIQENFLTPASPSGYVPTNNNFTSTVGDANLLNYLNSAYAGGANAGKFVFLRVSYKADAFAAGYDAYKITARNSGAEGEWPRVTVTVDDAVDTDKDGMPDIWEGANGLDPYDDGSINTNNGAIGNPDADGLTNIEEYGLGTRPKIDDTDEDGLLDGDEVNSLSTNPLLWDTDGDGLSDGDEVNTRGTNPLTKHSDTDDEDDFLEIWQGTDPLDPLSSSAALGLAIVDGALDAAYGDAVSTQTVNTAWADNLDELDAAYAFVQKDRLFVMLTGNMNTNWNAVEIFIDTTDAVTTNLLETAGNDNTTNMNGLVFDEGFSPDYHLMVRMGPWNGAYNFNVDFADLSTKAVSYHLNLFNNLDGGTGYMGPGDASSSSMAIAFTNSNTAGLVSGIGAADTAAALAVTSGLEFSVALADLGDPYGEIRVMAMMTTDSHATLSNQILGGLVPSQNALGASNEVDFNDYSENQFFSFLGRLVPAPVISAMRMASGNTEVQFNLTGLVAGQNYKVQNVVDLVNDDFIDVAGSEFAAAGTNETVTVSVDTGASSKSFYKVLGGGQ